MDMDNEMARLKWLLVAGLIFVVSAFFYWRELKYAVVGKRTDAWLVRVYETTESGRRGRRVEKLVVEYQFKESVGATRKESDTIAIDADRPAGPTVAVQYLNGSPGSSRLAGNTRQWWLFVFFGSLAFAGFKVFQIVRESKR